MKKRNAPGYATHDPSSIASITYNEKSGSQKNTEVGAKLIPLKIDATTYTTDASTRRALPSMGRNLAIYNNGTIGAVTFGDATVTALAAGAVDANGNVGIACKPNDWTFVAAGEATHVITTAATILCYLIDDDSTITPQAAR